MKTKGRCIRIQVAGRETLRKRRTKKLPLTGPNLGTRLTATDRERKIHYLWSRVTGHFCN